MKLSQKTIDLALSEYDGGDQWAGGDTPAGYGNFDRAAFLSSLASDCHKQAMLDFGGPYAAISDVLDIISEELD